MTEMDTMPQDNNAQANPTMVDAKVVGLAMLNATVAGQIAILLQIATPATDVMNLLCEHIGKLLSLVEPEQLRNSILGEIRRNLPAVVNRHVEARMTTPGGVLLPGVGERLQ